MLPTLAGAVFVSALLMASLETQPFQQAAGQREPQTAAEWVAEGDRLYALRSFERAAAAYRNANLLNAGDGHVLLRLAVSDNETGRFDEALAAADALIKLNPRLAAAHNERGYAQKALGDARAPGSAEEKTRYSAAVASYRQALSLDPSLGWAHLGLGDTYYALGSTAEALAAYAAAAGLMPGNSDARFNAGALLAEVGRYTEAVDHFSAVVRLDDSHYEARGSLAAMYRRLGRFPEALEQLRLALRTKPDHAATHARFAVLHASQGNQAAALDAYRIAESLDKQATDTMIKNAGVSIQIKPAAAAAPGSGCPTVITTGPQEIFSGEAVTFRATVRGAKPASPFSFNWTVSAGTISTGQGTNAIGVNTSGIQSSVTAFVQVIGLPKECAGESAVRTRVVGRRLPY